MKKLLYTTFAFAGLMLCQTAGAQTFTPACGETFYDSGGPDGIYEPFEEITYIICPDVAGEVVTVDFTFVDVERCCDRLEVYQGNGTTGDATDVTEPITFTSTAADGCLTVVWDSDDSGQFDGYAAMVSCAAPVLPPVEWTPTVAGNHWNEPANWTPNRVPLPTDVVLGAGTTSAPRVTDAQTVAFLIVEENDLEVLTTGSISITGLRDFPGLIVGANASVNVSGSLTASAAESVGIFLDGGELIVPAGGTVTVNNSFEGIDAEGLLSVSGSVSVANVERDGIVLDEAISELVIEAGGAVTIDAAGVDGLYGERGQATIAGSLTITGSGRDCIFTPGSEIDVTTTGTVLLDGCGGFGWDDADFQIDGAVSIMNTDNDGLNTRGNCSVNAGGSVSISNSGEDGIDIQDGRRLRNEGTISVVGADEFALVDGEFANLDGGVLEIDGAVAGVHEFAAGSTLAPGASPGCVDFISPTVLASGSTLALEVDGLSACSEHDQVQAADDLTVSGVELDLSGTYVASIGESVILIAKDGGVSVNGTFNGLPEGASVNFNGVSFTITYLGGDGNDVELIAQALLPLDLLYFTGEVRGKRNHLRWETANEEAFDRFEPERSTDGIHFDLLGLAAGRGEFTSGTQTLAYDFTDAAPPPRAYYRLKMVDDDGSFTYSDVVYLERASVDAISVFPNPNDGRFTALLPLAENETELLSCYDLTGRLIFRRETGRRYVREEALPVGVYVLRMGEHMKRVVVPGRGL